MKSSLGSLVEKLGTDDVNKLLIEYLMLLTAKSSRLDKIVEYVNENGSINTDTLNEMLGGDLSGEVENFHT